MSFFESTYIDYIKGKGYSELLLHNTKTNEWIYFNGEKFVLLGSKLVSGKKNAWRRSVEENTYAFGTLSSNNGLSLINELGPEALVTPEGTVTSLPSHTGIVPADITKNLWTLGELAPNILRALQMDILPDQLGGTSRGINNITDESLNVTTLNMNVNADASFDPQQFVQALRAQAALTRNLK